MSRHGAAGVLLALALPLAAAAHEVVHEIVRGKAVALHAHFPDGEPLAYVEYQVFAPSDPAIPFQKGRTDRAGWLAFVPTEPGPWRVKVVDATGHGLDVSISADATDANAAPAPRSSAIWGVLRPALGVAAVAGAFAVLVVAHRLRRPRA